jgi:predicted transcriptional regulator
MSTLADNAMLVARALTRAKKDGLSFYELQQATRLAAEYLPGILHMLEQQGWVVSALVDGIQPPKRLWHLRKQAKGNLEQYSLSAISALAERAVAALVPR